MTLEELKQSWVSCYRREVQEDVWDRVAENYKNAHIPDPQKDPFLRLMAEEIPLDKSMRTLDIGCGAGVYSLALAPLVGEAVGLDVSREMVRLANEKKAELGVENASFVVERWEDADIDALGFRGAFDVAFVHMSMAICDYETAEKINACTRNLCMVMKPCRSTNPILSRALELAHAEPEPDDNGMTNLFLYAWNKGYEPRLWYGHTENEVPRTVEYMSGWCIERASLKKTPTEAERDAIRAYIESIAVDGVVMERTTSTQATMVWRKNL